MFYDRDADGVRDGAEPGLDNFRVFLDENGNGVLDGTERQTSTNAGGEFRFGELLPGRAYTVTQALPVAWSNTAPGSGPTPVATPDLDRRTSERNGRGGGWRAGTGRRLAPRAGAARIVGGSDVLPGELPGAVALLVPPISSRFEALYCGGTLIAGRWVLTAAGCVVEGGVVDVPDVLLGTLDVDAGGMRIQPRRVVVHPDYDETTFAFNAALIELPTVQLHPRAIAFETIPESLVTAGATLTATGWGAVTPDGEFFFTTLQRAEVDVVSNALCDQVYGHISADMLCAGGDPGVGICAYDDGGGLYGFSGSRTQLVGVASWSGVDEDLNCAVAGLPSGWTRIGAIMPFLRQYVLEEPSQSVTVDGRSGITAHVEFGNFR